MTEKEVVAFVMREIEAQRGGWIVTMNLDHLRRFAIAPVQERRQEARLVTADGMPLIWASRIAGDPLPERVTGANLIYSLSAGAAAAGRSIFLLGGAGTSAAETGAELAKRYPRLRVAGTNAAERDLLTDERALEAVVEQMVETKPDIIFVALGSPKQELIIDRVRERLPAAWWLGVGIAFSFASGQVARAPEWMQRTGLEWLHRLAQEPRRLGKRYLVQGVPFAIYLLAHAAVMRLRRMRGGARRSFE